MADVPVADAAKDKTYVHPVTLTDEALRTLTRICIRDLQSMAFVRDGKRWAVWCPLKDAERFQQHIENALED